MQSGSYEVSVFLQISDEAVFPNITRLFRAIDYKIGFTTLVTIRTSLAK